MDKLLIAPRLVVHRLEHLAFSVSFKEILVNLALGQDHRPEKNQLEIAKFGSLLPPEFRHSLTSENIINFVRIRLDYHLKGMMSDKIR